MKKINLQYEIKIDKSINEVENKILDLNNFLSEFENIEYYKLNKNDFNYVKTKIKFGPISTNTNIKFLFNSNNRYSYRISGEADSKMWKIKGNSEIGLEKFLNKSTLIKISVIFTTEGLLKKLNENLFIDYIKSSIQSYVNNLNFAIITIF